MNTWGFWGVWTQAWDPVKFCPLKCKVFLMNDLVFQKLSSSIEHIELPAKLLDYFLRSNKSNINSMQPALEQLCGKQTLSARKWSFRANLLYVPNIKTFEMYRRVRSRFVHYSGTCAKRTAAQCQIPIFPAAKHVFSRKSTLRIAAVLFMQVPKKCTDLDILWGGAGFHDN